MNKKKKEEPRESLWAQDSSPLPPPSAFPVLVSTDSLTGTGLNMA